MCLIRTEVRALLIHQFPKQQRDHWQVIGDKASLGGSLQNLPLTVMELQLWVPGQVL